MPFQFSFSIPLLRMTRSIRGIALALVLSTALDGSLLAQNAKGKLNDLIRETQKQGVRSGRVTLVWWIPVEFWRAALNANGTVPAEKTEEMVASVSDVNVFIVVDAKIGAFAALTYEPQTELEKNLSVIDPEGKPLGLIPEAKQSATTRNLVSMMKPLLSNMMGDLGKNLSFFIYEGKEKNGARRVDPTKDGTLIARLGAEEFKWRLPLGSLLPAKVCPKCSETFPGNYVFCPFDATALKDSNTEKK